MRKGIIFWPHSIVRKMYMSWIQLMWSNLDLECIIGLRSYNLRFQCHKLQHHCQIGLNLKLTKTFVHIFLYSRAKKNMIQANIWILWMQHQSWLRFCTIPAEFACNIFGQASKWSHRIYPQWSYAIFSSHIMILKVDQGHNSVGVGWNFCSPVIWPIVSELENN